MTEFILEFMMTFAILIRDYILSVCMCVCTTLDSFSIFLARVCKSVNSVIAS